MQTDIPFFDAMTITYECPHCGHSQKWTLKFKSVGDEIKFQCKDCGFENAVILSEGDS